MEGLRVGWAAGAGDHGDEGGQVAIFRSQAVRNPRTEGGTSPDLVPGLKQGHRWVVIDGFGVKGTNDAEVVCMPGDVGEKLAKRDSGFSVWLERVGRGSNGESFLSGCHSGQSLTVSNRIGEVFVEMAI